jgi:hypothetical protein
MLTGTARAWIKTLLEKSINNWKDMKDDFTRKFEGTYKRLHTAVDLQCCIQQKDESSRLLLARWITMKKGCENVSEETAILKICSRTHPGKYLKA